MTYCLSSTREFDRVYRRSVSRDIVSQAMFALVSTLLIALAGAFLLSARPGDSLRIAKAPKAALAPALRIAAPRAAAPAAADRPAQIALREVMAPLDFAPLSLAESAPRAANFEALAPAIRLAQAQPENVVAVPAPLPAGSDIAENVPLPAPRPPALGLPAGRIAAPGRQLAQQNAAPAPAAPTDTRSIFDKLFGTSSAPQPSGTVLAYANPEDGLLKTSPSVTSPSASSGMSGPATAYDKWTAVYDISAKTVYLPNGTKLEAHSGLRDMLDDPRHVAVRMRGATPPAVYDLKLREKLFHGVEALRLTPLDSNVFGRAGLLAHTFMLGPNGDSNGCVSFRNYDAFLKAFKNGEVKRLAVVARL
jgi:hypothetical protein